MGAFHAGEQAMHQRLGIAERMSEIGSRVIRDHMPDQHRQFYAQLPFVLVGSVDAALRPWASLLVGQPGFLSTPDEHHLAAAAQPMPGDPLARNLVPGAPLGLLGIELPTRRRNRVNGLVSRVDASGWLLDVEETTGNCPQYIQQRELTWRRDPADVQPRDVQPLTALDDEAQALIAGADTLFVASHAHGRSDVSHRGGRAGFVRVDGSGRLLVPDFSGNLFFMTPGNFVSHPHAGLLFIDFERGDLLSLTGRVEMVFDGPDVEQLDSAERAWRFELDEGLWLRDALPLGFDFKRWSPRSLATGSWSTAAPDQR
jgi:predicted pyridoxine 5'-phosphate oxidase superfamily flavin-nucleotide-binding protein